MQLWHVVFIIRYDHASFTAFGKKNNKEHQQYRTKQSYKQTLFLAFCGLFSKCIKTILTLGNVMRFYALFMSLQYSFTWLARLCYCSSIKYKKIKGVFSLLPLVMGFNIVSLFSKEIIKLSFERKHRRENISII